MAQEALTVAQKTRHLPNTIFEVRVFDCVKLTLVTFLFPVLNAQPSVIVTLPLLK